jgi:ABC-type multidrug transport system ATPase subunit
LLSLLTLTPTECKQSGYVTLNGHKVDSQLLRNFCSFVPQDDHLWPFLTCRETLSYAADFYLSKSSQEKKAEVDRLIKELGLEKCANTICGNQFLKGLSGGQKRRLSLALALIKNPLVLFLDEPTSGLDSASASWIMAFLNNYVKERGVIVICTIHQPSTAIFKQFDSTMLLSGGRVAYVGPALEATRYFKESFHAAMPEDYSPAEFVLEFINSDFGDAKKKEEVEQVLDAWRSRAIVPPSDPAKEPLPAQGCRTTSFVKQVISQTDIFVFSHDIQIHLEMVFRAYLVRESSVSRFVTCDRFCADTASGYCRCGSISGDSRSSRSGIPRSS